MSTNISSAARPTVPAGGSDASGAATNNPDLPSSLFFQYDHSTGPSRPDLPPELFFKFDESVSRAVQDAAQQSPDPSANPAPREAKAASASRPRR
ncbi:hypothetical protein ACFSUI_19340 [Ralstonia solanacearum]